MSEINSIANGTYTIGQTSATNYVAGPGIKIDEPSAGTVRIGTDETVLWSGEPTASTNQIVVSENFSNFDRVRIYWKSYERHYADEVWAGTDTVFPIVVGAVFALSDGNYEKSMTIWNTSNGTTYTWASTIHGSFNGTQSKTWNSNVIPMKIVGINRKEV